MEGEAVYHEVPLDSEDQKEKSVTIRMPKRVETKKVEHRCLLITFIVGIVLLLAAVLASALLVYFLLEAKVSTLEEKIALNNDHFPQVDETLISHQCAIAPNLTQLPNGKKYFFSDPIYRNWTEADKGCKRMGLHLATPRDEADLNATWVEAKKTKDDVPWWLSAKNYGNERKYDIRWQDGSELEQNSTLWRAYGDKLTGGCVFFSTDPDLSEKLSGRSCRGNRFFICELPSECY
ncbi:uncharacterized protein LOC132197091 [Neocloeon triangulifer]|uniref:uncharacterized protein LOC132197091 n=1 Tax=Neocloeon triangulifer TaxID=2078957 RepID=UPI00286F44F8|nr:uncharacterized protein LOC132197091 [Neocloeon triangulifer]